MLNTSFGGIYIVIAVIIFYYIVAVKWVKLGALASSLVFVGVPFAYNVILGLIQASLLRAPLSGVFSLNSLITTVLQIIAAFFIFREIRKAQEGSMGRWLFWLIIGFGVLFFLVPQVVIWSTIVFHSA